MQWDALGIAPLAASPIHTKLTGETLVCVDDEMLDLPDLKCVIENDKLPSDFESLLTSPVLTAKMMSTSLENEATASSDTPTGKFSSSSVFKARSDLRSFKRVKRIPSLIRAKISRRFDSVTDGVKTIVSEEAVKTALEQASGDSDLIGDFSQRYALPSVIGDHPDLKTITPNTMASVLTGKYSDSVDSYTVIDCRYPYEYLGGHVNGALNMYTKTQVQDNLLNDDRLPAAKSRHIIIFHCEFSAQRGPNM